VWEGLSGSWAKDRGAGGQLCLMGSQVHGSQGVWEGQVGMGHWVPMDTGCPFEFELEIWVSTLLKHGIVGGRTRMQEVACARQSLPLFKQSLPCPPLKKGIGGTRPLPIPSSLCPVWEHTPLANPFLSLPPPKKRH